MHERHNAPFFHALRTLALAPQEARIIISCSVHIASLVSCIYLSHPTFNPHPRPAFDFRFAYKFMYFCMNDSIGNWDWDECKYSLFTSIEMRHFTKER